MNGNRYFNEVKMKKRLMWIWALAKGFEEMTITAKPHDLQLKP